ncbi:Cytochrome c-type biogenesis protein CcmF [Raoultella terrigena]|nr:Cytochrome c-type biogenesis protein CcmF [Raoultella terrigena]
MMPELGNYLLCLAAGLALLLSIYPLWGASRQDRRMMALARPLACALFFCIVGAFLVLVHAFVVNDFTVRYVAENSNSALPVWYRVAATWGRPRGLSAAVGAAAERLDLCGGAAEPPHAARRRRQSAGGNGDDCLRLSAVYSAHL